ncbi:hypothetical protein BGX34_000615 [Mortierella sp. NVP85]|nr:hypothetical protein BGX34_000615 [Mortierella sp. NVP85]
MAADEYIMFEIECSRQQPGRSITLIINPKECPDSQALLTSRWKCVVERRSLLFNGLVNITLETFYSQSECTLPKLKHIHCIPKNATKVADVQVFKIPDQVKFLIKSGHIFTMWEGPIIDKNNQSLYSFTLVLSTSKDLPSHLHPEKSGVAAKPFKEMFPDMYQDMIKLLKDPGSVNVSFVFTIHNCRRKVALWAHRTLLDKYPRFQELFDAFCPKTDQNDASNNRLVLVPIEGISLTTFCVLLKYLYTQDLDLVVDPSQFLMCDMDQVKDKRSTDSISPIAVLNKSLISHNTAQFYATWNVKDKVTWSDLFIAADRFEIAKLRKKCLDSLLASLDESNAVEIVFGVGMCFKEEIQAPVIKYIAEHLEDVFSLRTKDPFKHFKDHEGYPDVMLELLRESRTKQ